MVIHLLFFKGYGFVPLMIRLLTWHWWRGQRWRQVPAHVAIAIPVGSTLSEYEAITTGVHVSLLAESDVSRLSGLIADLPVEVPLLGATVRWLDAQVGKPYGYLASAATGLGIVSPRWLDRWWKVRANCATQLLAALPTRSQGGWTRHTGAARRLARFAQ